MSAVSPVIDIAVILPGMNPSDKENDEITQYKKIIVSNLIPKLNVNLIYQETNKLLVSSYYF